jgi:hypothetical protein
MFGDIRKFVSLSNQDCIANYKPLVKPEELKNEEPKNYYVDASICLVEVPDQNH